MLCECIYCCNSYKSSYIVIKKIKGSMDLVEVKSAWSPTSSNLLFFVNLKLLWLLLEPYIYHVLLPMMEPVPLVLLTIVDTNHIKMGGGWSFVSELQLHPLVICSSQTENHSENVSVQNHQSFRSPLLVWKRRTICKLYTCFPWLTRIYFLIQANNEMTHLRLAFLGHQKGLWPLFVLGCVGAGFTLWYMKR